MVPKTECGLDRADAKRRDNVDVMLCKTPSSVEDSVEPIVLETTDIVVKQPALAALGVLLVSLFAAQTAILITMAKAQRSDGRFANFIWRMESQP